MGSQFRPPRESLSCFPNKILPSLSKTRLGTDVWCYKTLRARLSLVSYLGISMHPLLKMNVLFFTSSWLLPALFLSRYKEPPPWAPHDDTINTKLSVSMKVVACFLRDPP
jgi:hypothetical protein